ncbi:MAG: inositol monophosphatase family protein [Azospirillaceae bacterium]|nr:inositol monophosphatase family protein [Azospirillaceae bacterium]
MVKLPDMDRVSEIIRETCEIEVLPRFRHLSAQDVREKGPGDLVTVADEASERRLTAELSALLPGSLVIGEEAVAADPRVLDRFRDDAPVWIVDPIDGTFNFASGNTCFGLLVALVQGGETLAGWVYDPLGGRMATVVKGQGAWLAGNRLTVRAAAPLSELRGSLTFANYEASTRQHLEQAAQKFRDSAALNCAAHEYLRLTGPAVPTGDEIHFALFRKIMPWDHAAGTLLHREAGGYHAKLDGTPYAPTDSVGGLLLAPDQETWLTLRDLLFPARRL